jgi:hypothetical protein
VEGALGGSLFFSTASTTQKKIMQGRKVVGRSLLSTPHPTATKDSLFLLFAFFWGMGCGVRGARKSAGLHSPSRQLITRGGHLDVFTHLPRRCDRYPPTITISKKRHHKKKMHCLPTVVTVFGCASTVMRLGDTCAMTGGCRHARFCFFFFLFWWVRKAKKNYARAEKRRQIKGDPQAFFYFVEFCASVKIVSFEHIDIHTDAQQKHLPKTTTTTTTTECKWK